MKPQLLIDSTKYIQQVIPYALALGAVYQLSILGSMWLLELFSWTQVINDTFIILPLLLIVVAIYFSCINSIKQYLQWDRIESAERWIFACLVVVYLVINGYESLRWLLLWFSAAIVLKYTTETILIKDSEHIIWYTKFYDKALLLMPFVCTIVLSIIWFFLHWNEFTWLYVCIDTDTICIKKEVIYKNNLYVISKTYEIYPTHRVAKFLKVK
jgi:hypothetical protein